MRNTFRVLVVFGLAAVGGPGVASANDHVLGADVAVRVYESPTLAPEDQRAARSVASDILEAAGLDIRWLVCPDAAPMSEECGVPLGPRELAIRFIGQPASPSPARTTQLGYSMLDTRARAGSLATIYIDRVVRLAEDSGARADSLLGRAIAHEIGHLVIGTTAHARAGLMRSVWSQQELRRNQASDWLFTPGDARSMHEALQIQ